MNAQASIHKKTGNASLKKRVMVTLVIGLSSGLAGMSLAMLLHAIQHLAYGYSMDLIISDENFLEGVLAASAKRRVFVLIGCGFIAGFGWWAIARYGKPLVSIAAAIKAEHPSMPMMTTIWHVLIQIVTIAMGSPLGREVAPRELSALFACWLSEKTNLNHHETRIMVACAAGAGLAAVYNVPLGGAVFTLEVLLNTLRWSALLPAITTSALAVLISWTGLGNEPQYHIPMLTINPSLVIWSILIGPLVGIAAFWFRHVADLARQKAPKNWQLPVLCILNFTLIGLLAIYFPSLLGNGKSPVQLEFDSAIGIGLAMVLLVLRTLITWSSFRAGAQGGLLTPSLANGALLGALLGGLWSIIWPASPPAAFAIIGAAAFLAPAQKMPLTALILVFELTRIPFDFLIPILFSLAGSLSVQRFFTRRYPS